MYQMCGWSKNMQLLLEQLTRHSMSKAGKQRYKCKGCGKTQIKHDTYPLAVVFKRVLGILC